MSEETPTQVVPVVPPKVAAVCSHCFEQSTDGFVIEWNFSDKMVYFFCPKCKKMNDMGFRAIVANPLPKARLVR
jgi:hypothetical protein